MGQCHKSMLADFDVEMVYPVLGCKVEVNDDMDVDSIEQDVVMASPCSSPLLPSCLPTQGGGYFLPPGLVPSCCPNCGIKLTWDVPSSSSQPSSGLQPSWDLPSFQSPWASQPSVLLQAPQPAAEAPLLIQSSQPPFDPQARNRSPWASQSSFPELADNPIDAHAVQSAEFGPCPCGAFQARPSPTLSLSSDLTESESPLVQDGPTPEESVPLDSPPLSPSANIFSPEIDEGQQVEDSVADEPLEDDADEEPQYGMTEEERFCDTLDSILRIDDWDSYAACLSHGIGRAHKEPRVLHRYAPYDRKDRIHPRNRYKHDAEYLPEGSQKFDSAELAQWLAVDTYDDKVNSSHQEAARDTRIPERSSRQSAVWSPWAPQVQALSIRHLAARGARAPLDKGDLSRTRDPRKRPSKATDTSEQIPPQLGVGHAVPVVPHPASEDEVLRFLATVATEIVHQQVDPPSRAFR